MYLEIRVGLTQIPMAVSSKKTPGALISNQYRSGVLKHLQLLGLDDSRENMVAISHWHPKILEFHSKDKANTAKTMFPRVVSLDIGKEIGLLKCHRSRDSNSLFLNTYVNVPTTTAAAFNEYLDTVFIDAQIDLIASGGPMIPTSIRTSLSSSAKDAISDDESNIARLSSVQQRSSYIAAEILYEEKKMSEKKLIADNKAELKRKRLQE